MLSRRILNEVSLENNMACGVGACLCCVENTTEGNVCVCKEGPVLNIRVIMAALNVKINGLKLKNPVMTASGTFGYGLEFADFVPLDGRRHYGKAYYVACT